MGYAFPHVRRGRIKRTAQEARETGAWKASHDGRESESGLNPGRTCGRNLKGSVRACRTGTTIKSAARDWTRGEVRGSLPIKDVRAGGGYPAMSSAPAAFSRHVRAALSAAGKKHGSPLASFSPSRLHRPTRVGVYTVSRCLPSRSLSL